MTRDRARKRSVRARMTASGEPYSVAARKLASSAEPALSLLAERVNATLAARSARIRYRVETDLATREDLRAKFVRFIGDALLKRIVPGMEASIGGVAGEGFIEPPTGRYQIYWVAMPRSSPAAGNSSGAPASRSRSTPHRTAIPGTTGSWNRWSGSAARLSPGSAARTSSGIRHAR